MKTDYSRLQRYWQLMRMDKPIGILLLLWPTMWGLVWASQGLPAIKNTIVFALGTILMRAAGCVMNDIADRDFDRHVKRTAQRPLTSGQVSLFEAIAVACSCLFLSVLLLLFLDASVLPYACLAGFLAGSYPFMKRWIAIPQAYLGVAFGFGVPMAFVQVQGEIPFEAWALVLANIAWTVAYDTQYAMVDLVDDLKIGIKTSAICFGDRVVPAVMICYFVFLSVMAYLGWRAELHFLYYAGLTIAAYMACQHYMLIKNKDTNLCFKAFLDNGRLGGAVFVGTLLGWCLK